MYLDYNNLLLLSVVIMGRTMNNMSALSNLKPVHSWDINCHVKLSYRGRELIKEMKQKLGMTARELAILSFIPESTMHRILNHEDYYTNSLTLRRISIQLGISLESEIESICAPFRHKFSYKIKFPLQITPAHLRIISHVVGDGHITGLNLSKCSLQYGQKAGIENLQQLVRSVIDFSPRIYSNDPSRPDKVDVMTIPKILGNIIVRALRLSSLHKLKRGSFIERILTLPRDYQMQFLLAFVYDEATVKGKAIAINQQNKSILKLVKKVCKKLGYKYGKIYPTDKKGNHRFLIKPVSFIDFYKDVRAQMKKHGKLLGLWDKYKDLLQLVLTRYDKIFYGKRIRPVVDIIRLKFRNETFTPRQIMQELNTRNRAYANAVRSLAKKGFSQKINMGLYRTTNKLHEIFDIMEIALKELVNLGT